MSTIPCWAPGIRPPRSRPQRTAVRISGRDTPMDSFPSTRCSIIKDLFPMPAICIAKLPISPRHSPFGLFLRLPGASRPEDRSPRPFRDVETRSAPGRNPPRPPHRSCRPQTHPPRPFSSFLPRTRTASLSPPSRPTSSTGSSTTATCRRKPRP